MKTIKRVSSIDITLEIFESIIVTALEGGSNYWYLLDTEQISSQIPNYDSKEPLSTQVSKALFENPNFFMKVYDIENPEDVLGEVNQQSIHEALELALKDYPNRFEEIISDDYDAETADVLFQLATMKDIVFG
jgi:hypothetical protein